MFTNIVRKSVVGRFAAGLVSGLALYGVVAFAPPAYAQDAAQAADPTAAVAAPAAIPAAQGKGPALWVLKDEDSTIYLFGTVHALRPEIGWGTPKMQAAFDSADEVWFEIENVHDQAAAMPVIQRLGLSPDRPLSSLLSAEEIAHLDVAASSMGITAAQMDPMRPWLVSLTLAVAPLLKAGYDPQSGVDGVLQAHARAAGKPIKGLETVESQLTLMGTMSEETQLAMLRSTLTSFDDAVEMLDGMVGAWSGGDVDAIDRVMVEEMKDQSQDLYDVMLTRRNTDWVGQIETMMEGSGTIFIAVGAAHLAGDDSVQAILARRGVTAERLN